MNNNLFEPLVSSIEDLFDQAVEMKSGEYQRRPKVREKATREGGVVTDTDTAIAIAENRLSIGNLFGFDPRIEIIDMELDEAIEVVTAKEESLGLIAGIRTDNGQSYRLDNPLSWPLHVMSTTYYGENKDTQITYLVGKKQYVSRALAYLLLSQNHDEIAGRVRAFHELLDSPTVQKSTLD